MAIPELFSNRFQIETSTIEDMRGILLQASEMTMSAITIHELMAKPKSP